MRQVFTNWDEAWKAIDTEGTYWEVLYVNGAEIYAYKNSKEEILLTDVNDVDDPDWEETVL